MSEPFVAEVRIWALNFAPRGWAFCDGQLLNIAQNTALFSLLGTTYGGDGRTTLALPNLQGRAPMHPGRGPGLTQRRLGQKGGVESVALTTAQMASHTHQLKGSNADTSEEGQKNPANHVHGLTEAASRLYGAPNNLGAMAAAALPGAGGDQSNEGVTVAHTNMQPYLSLNFTIALTGVYPSRD